MSNYQTAQQDTLKSLTEVLHLFKTDKELSELKPGYISNDLLSYIRESGSASLFRKTVAGSTEVWSVLTECYKLGQTRLLEYPNIIRTYNGILLLGRNLVSVDNVAFFVWESGAVNSVFDLLRYLILDTQKEGGISVKEAMTSNGSENTVFYEKCVMVCIQFFSNLSVQASEDKTLSSNIFSLFIYNIPTEALASLLDSFTSGNSLPLLILLEGLIKNTPVNALRLYEEPNGLLFVKFIATHAQAWMNSDNDMCSNVVVDIMIHLLSFGLMPNFLEKFFTNTDVIEPQKTFDFFILLIDCLPLAFKSLERNNTENFANNIDQQKKLFETAFSIFKSIKEQAEPLIKTYNTRDRSKDNKQYLNGTWETLVIFLDFFDNYLSSVFSQYEDNVNLDSSNDLFNFIVEELDFLESIIGLLHAAEANLPKKSKLSELQHQYTNDEENSDLSSRTRQSQYDSSEFPLIKGKIIVLLGLLTKDNTVVQNEIRRLHALELILSNMIIDQNNPYIKEQAILTLSYVLKNNQENQDFISKLEAKEVVSTQEIEDAGLEVKVVDGKVRLNKKD